MRPGESFDERSAARTHRLLLIELGRRQLAPTRLVDSLRRGGYDVSSCEGVDAYLATARDARFGAVVVDAERVVPTAVEVCRALRQHPATAEAAIVLVTGERNVEAFEAALAAGFDDFLSRWADESTLLESLRAASTMREARAVLADWKTLQSQRERALRQQLWAERLGALLVHDLKAPLNAIDLLAQGLLRHGALAGTRREAVVDIRDQTQRLVGMVVDLLDISRSREGALRANVLRVDAHELCRSLQRDFEQAALAKNVALEIISFASELHADPQLLRRAVANLVDNALHHVRSGGCVTVVISPRRGHTQLRVSDDGPGVPVELRDSIFDAFRQLAPSNPHGRGLGLTFCKLAVAAHQGQIWLEDQPQGTVVTIALPFPAASLAQVDATG